MSEEGKSNKKTHLVHMWWEVVLVRGGDAIAQLKFSGEYL